MFLIYHPSQPYFLPQQNQNPISPLQQEVNIDKYSLSSSLYFDALMHPSLFFYMKSYYYLPKAMQNEQGRVFKQDLSIIITTSPIPSNPSTEIIEMALRSIRKEDSLADVDIYIVCDGAKVGEEPSKYKSGLVSTKSWSDYCEFKQRLKKIVDSIERVYLEERAERHGFADNIFFIMSKVPQQFVMIFQHDHVLLRKVDFVGIVNCMKKHPINYIGVMNRSVKKLPHELDQHLPLRKYFSELVGYQSPNVKHQHNSFTEQVLGYYTSKYEIPLMPLLFWYDKVHIARKSYYLNEIFNPNGYLDEITQLRHKTVSFVEDSFGTTTRRGIRNRPAKFEQLNAFIYWDDLQSAVAHSHGRGFVTQQTRQLLYLNQNKEEISSSQSEVGEQEQMGLDFLLGDGFS